MTSTERILLVRPDKAGDAIKSIPALRALADGFPQWEVHCLVSAHNRSLLETETGLTLWELPKDWERLSTDDLKKWVKQSGLPVFAKAISLLPDYNASVESLLNALGGKLEFLPAPAGQDESVNVALLLGNAIGTRLESAALKAARAPHLTPQDTAEAAERLGEKRQRWVAVCPLAGDNVRTPRLQRWRRFLRLLSAREKQSRFFLFGAPGDARHLEIVKGNCSPSQVELVHPSSFRALGAYLKRMDLVLAVDSGPLHFAVALGCPTIGFMSGGDKARWCARLGPTQHVLRRGLLDRFPSTAEMVAYYLWAGRTIDG